MRRILSLAALSVSLMGGVAAADRDHDRGREVVRERTVVHERERPIVREREVVRERERPVIREDVRVERYRDFHRRPEVRVENFAPVRGYSWHRGDWIWNGYEWIWQPGWYVRVGL